MESKTTYTLSLDILAKIITIGILLLFLILGFSNIQKILQEPESTATSWWILIICIAVPLFSWLYAPKSYQITQTALIIIRPVKNKKILFSEITQVQVLERGKQGFNIRTFGVGGLFGYFGRFYASKLGSFRLYGSRRNHQILLEGKKGEKIVITPDDLGLTAVLKEKIEKNNLEK